MITDLSLQEHLAELKQRLELWKKYEKTQLKEFLEDIEVKDKIMHNMLIAIQSAIDAGDDIIRLKHLEMPSTYKEIFIILKKHRILERALAKKLENLAGFRNVLVHLYRKIRFKEVYSVLKTKRKVLEAFYKKISRLNKF